MCAPETKQHVKSLPGLIKKKCFLSFLQSTANAGLRRGEERSNTGSQLDPTGVISAPLLLLLKISRVGCVLVHSVKESGVVIWQTF